jgi:hypothetical protein
MAQYAILIYDSEAAWGGASAETVDRIHKGHAEFGAANGGVIRGGDALQATATATSIRHDSSGEVTVTDGPFAETKEALGGFYVVEAADLDAAIAIARQIPVIAGGVEVRPVMVFE